jgi:hypothetical protein
LARKSDFRSSFLALEKKALLKKLGMKSWIKLLKKQFILEILQFGFFVLRGDMDCG